MTRISRRQLSMLLASTPLVPVSEASLIGFREAELELATVARQWRRENRSPPAQYLLRKLGHGPSAEEVRDIITAEYRRGDVMEVRGLVLSTTEAATLAALAKGA